MKAIFLTEREAKEFINNNFGANAEIKTSSVDDRSKFDVDEMPFSWSGETQAYEVNDGEAYVGFWEPAGAVYTVTLKGVSVKTESMYQAREIASEMKEVAEDCNISGTIVISDEDGEECDSEDVEPFDEDEPEGDNSSFLKAWKRHEIGMVIKAARAKKGLSIRELAKLAGMSKNNVERIENGVYNYTIDNLNAIAEVLGIKLL